MSKFKKHSIMMAFYFMAFYLVSIILLYYGGKSEEFIGVSIALAVVITFFYLIGRFVSYCCLDETDRWDDEIDPEGAE